MRDIPTMIDGVTTLPADLFNEIPTELENAITSSGQNLTPEDGSNPNLEQLAIAMAIYSAGANFYIDSGTANNYILSSVGSKKAPNSYFDGMKVGFIVLNENTTSSNINVANLGSKSIRRLNGSQLSAGDLSGYVELVYRNSLGYFVIVRSSNNLLYFPNLISSNSKIEPLEGGSEPIPDNTPRNYPIGYQLSKSWFVATQLVDLTYVDGLYNATSGTLYRDIPLENGLQFYQQNEFIASVATKNRKPLTTGISLDTSVSPGNIRVTINFAQVQNVFSAKVELGNIPSLHNVGTTGGGQGAVGGGADQIFYENDQTVTSNYTITDGKNAMSAGPITIDSGATVIVPVGSTWTVV